MPPVIHIIDAIPLSTRDRESILHSLQQIFGVSVVLSNKQIDLQKAFDNGRNQYNSTALLSQLLRLGIGNTDKIIALVGVDLFIPILTYVFGEAQLSGPAAIVSCHRLANRFYGMEDDVILHRERLEKEIVHEIGHTFGLKHCRQFECVMRSSTYVEEIDLKHSHFCVECRTLFQQFVDDSYNSQG